MEAARALVARLDQERRAIESDIQSLIPQLGAAGMTAPLVDGKWRVSLT
jgi:hypothetical protein